LTLEERYAKCRSVAEECINDEELLALLKSNDHPICYDGFEPSGRMHIAQVMNRKFFMFRVSLKL
jgi:tyrosyl-tRNA synthetase